MSIYVKFYDFEPGQYYPTIRLSVDLPPAKLKPSWPHSSTTFSIGISFCLALSILILPFLFFFFFFFFFKNGNTSFREVFIFQTYLHMYYIYFSYRITPFPILTKHENQATLQSIFSCIYKHYHFPHRTLLQLNFDCDNGCSTHFLCPNIEQLILHLTIYTWTYYRITIQHNCHFHTFCQ